MDAKTLLRLQTKRGAKTESSVENAKSLSAVVEDCRKRILNESASYRNLNITERREAIKHIISQYVTDVKPVVEGFVDSNKNIDTTALMNKLSEEIIEYGILTRAMTSDDIFEIRSNGPEIKVEIKGRVYDYTDENGRIVSFESPEQQEVVLTRMLGTTRLTPKDALVSASTIEGFRIAAVHSSAMSPDPQDPAAEKYHSFVLRKFAKDKMSIPDIIQKRTLSDNMGRFLSLMPAGGLTFVTVGPTASGKTTTNNAILQAVPPTTRTILVQNPSEIDLRFKNEYGRVYNDVLHLEAREVENPTPSDPTMTGVMNQILRLSPTFVCIGEIRANEEFKEASKILLAGHPINATFHAESAEGAVMRYLTAYLACSGNEPSHLALRTLTSILDVIVVQKIMRDGHRRIIQISEVLGVDKNDREKPEIRDIYRYEIDEEPEYDEAGNVKLIRGRHKRVNAISDRLKNKFKLEGVSEKRYDFLLNDPSDDETETYTGKNISHYGMDNIFD